MVLFEMDVFKALAVFGWRNVRGRVLDSQRGFPLPRHFCVYGIRSLEELQQRIAGRTLEELYLDTFAFRLLPVVVAPTALAPAVSSTAVLVLGCFDLVCLGKVHASHDVLFFSCDSSSPPARRHCPSGLVYSKARQEGGDFCKTPTLIGRTEGVHILEEEE